MNVGLSILSCDTNNVYIKFEKVTGKSSYLESFEVWNSTDSLYTSPVFSAQGNQIIEYCLPETTNSQYFLKLAPSSLLKWFESSSLTMYGRYGNIVFKDNLRHLPANGYYSFSLHYAVKKDTIWKLKSGYVPESWANVDYSDNLWNTMTVGTASQQLSGTQYFRKSFSGMINMAAYELKINYEYGVVAYINGNEIFRDNMNPGPVTSSTPASDSYAILEYRGCVRPGKEVESPQNILAIELHFIDLTISHPVSFNAYVAILMSPTSENNCYTYPYSMIIQSSPSNQEISKSFDFNYDSFAHFTASQLPIAMSFTFLDTKGYFNGFRFWSEVRENSLPRSFSVHGKTTSNQLYLISNVRNLSPKESVFVYSYAYVGLDLYSSYHLTINSFVNDTTLNLYELHPLVCSHTSTTFIEYQSLLYLFYTDVSLIHIQPIDETFTNCQITPSPPSGLSFNSTTCSLDGLMSSPLTLTSFVVTSTIGGVVYTGYFSLEVVNCVGTVVQFTRQYGTSMGEFFTVTDADSGGVVVQVDDSSASQGLNELKEYTYCLYGSHYTVTSSAVGTRWSPESYLLVSVILGISQIDPIARIRYDSVLGLPSTTTFGIQYIVQRKEEWWYLMGSVPAGWYESSLTGWTAGASPNYPDSTNAIQLYKKIVTISSLETIASLMISVRFNNDFVLYVNGYPVFNRNLNSFTSTTIGSHLLSQSVFHQVSIPVRTIGNATTPSIQYVVEGSNTIAFGFAGSSVTDVKSVFDCAIRLMESSNRGMNTAIEYAGISGSVSSILNDSSSTVISQSTCDSNAITITFENERYEWINAITLQLADKQYSEYATQLTIMGKNEFDSTWTVLRGVQDIVWNTSNRKILIWLSHGTSYTQLRLQSIGTGDSSSCSWKLGNIELLTVAFDINPPSTLYPSELHFIKDIAMEPVYPESAMFYSFDVSPSLPPGILIDPNTGGISGTPTTDVVAMAYTITARTLNGTLVTSVVTIDVELCVNDRGFFTVTVYQAVDINLFFRIHQGRGTNGTIIHLIDDNPLHGTHSSFNFCLPNGIYTLCTWDIDEAYHMGDGYYLSVDKGQFRFAVATNQRTVGPTYKGFATFTFSSVIPFQMEYSEWKVNYVQEMYNSAWKVIDYDDSDWTSVKASDIGTSELTSVYIRKTITIPSIDDYHVLNVRMKYTGGVIVSFNGIVNSRFAVPSSDYDIFTVSNNNNVRYSLFHVIFTAFNGVTGKNVIAFELHRFHNQTLDIPFVFDATGVFGVSECSPLVETVFQSFGFSSSVDISLLSDFDPLTIGTYTWNGNPFTVFSYRFDNDEGSMMNAVALHTPFVYSSLSFLIWGATPTPLFNETDVATPVNSYSILHTPYAMHIITSIGFNLLSYPSSQIKFYISELQFLYCVPPKDGSCGRIGDFYGVGDGEVSSIPCSFGYRGRQFRVCNHGVFSEPDTKNCIVQTPKYLHYSSSHYELIVGVPVNIPAPLYIYRIDSFFVDMDTPLPAGLLFNSTTGAITGTVTTIFSPVNCTIYGRNVISLVPAVLTLSARLAECPENDGFPLSSAGSFVIMKCSNHGDYVGIQSRSCLVGEEDGEWSSITGECYSTADCMPANLVYQLSPLVVGVGYSVDASCSIDGYHSYFHIVEGALPYGLQLNSENGTIYGVPTMNGVSSVVIVAENVAGSTNTTLEIKVMEPALGLQYEDSPFSIKVNKFFTTTPSYKGDEVSFTVVDGSLPDGLKLDEKSGVISGTPSVVIVDLSCEIMCMNPFGSSKTRVTFTVKKSSAVAVVLVVLLIIVVLGALGYGGYEYHKRRKHMIPKVTKQSTQKV